MECPRGRQRAARRAVPWSLSRHVPKNDAEFGRINLLPSDQPTGSPRSIESVMCELTVRVPDERLAALNVPPE